MKHADALSRFSCFFLSDSITHRLKEAKINDWTKAVRNLVEEDAYQDFCLQNDVFLRGHSMKWVQKFDFFFIALIVRYII